MVLAMVVVVVEIACKRCGPIDRGLAIEWESGSERIAFYLSRLCASRSLVRQLERIAWSPVSVSLCLTL